MMDSNKTPKIIGTIPTSVVEEMTKQREFKRRAHEKRERLNYNQALYRSRQKERGITDNRSVRTDSRSNHHKLIDGKKRPLNSERMFIGWDGEGPQDTGYSLFGNNLGYKIKHPFLLSEECLNLILRVGSDHPYAIHIWFGSNYDVSMILEGMDFRRSKILWDYNRCVWHDYEIEHIPGKWMKVTKDGVTVKIYDIFSFFGTGYVPALEKMDIGSKAEIELLKAEKARRSEFLWSEIDEIENYWTLELNLMPLLANKLRQLFLRYGYDLKSWHGPGSVAREALKKHKVKAAMGEPPIEVKVARRLAYAGGRFEMVRGGHINMQIYNADVNSAYPYYATKLPNLAKGQWRRTRKFEGANKFGVYEISYDAGPKDASRIYPLFRRLHDGTVIWPNRVTNWYWTPETELVTNDPCAHILDGWVFDEDDSTDRPFAWIAEYYERRLLLKKIGDPLEFTVKLIINSVYGQLAQRSGYNKKTNMPPPYHQLEWAGYITSGCRAAVYKAAISCGDKLISIDTDGIYAMCPVDGLDYGKELGQWEAAEFDAGIFWQSGVYNLRKGDDWIKGKTRGIPKGSYSAEVLLKCLDNGMQPLTITRKAFTGFGAALASDWDKRNTWNDAPHIMEFGGSGKRYHNKVFCRRGNTCHNGVHDFLASPIGTPGKVDNYLSEPHYIPWLRNNPEITANKHIVDSEMLIFEADDVDIDDQWMYDVMERI